MDYPLYDPSQGAPKIGQAILYLDPSFPYTPILDHWTGNVPQGQKIITQQQGIDALKQAPITGVAPQGWYNTTYSQASINKMLDNLTNLTGQYDAKPNKVLTEQFNPNASDLSKANWTPEYKAKIAAQYGGMVEIAPGEYVPKGSAGDPASALHDSSGIASAPTGTLASASFDITAPTTQLKKGDTGDAVKQLQDYLVANNYMTEAQKNTGYGTFGPQTEAAVTAMQSKLGVDNSTGPGVYGPRTIAAVSVAPAGGGTSGGTSGTTGGTSGSASNADLDAILNNPNLTDDQKAAIKAIFGAVQSNDADTAAKIQSAMTAASEFSSPYFRAQVQLATDALQRGISGKEGDLNYQETQLRSALTKLQSDTAASKDQLSFQHAQELQQLATKYQTDIQTTQDNLASAGFTSSSKRARAEQILGEQNTGLVESSNKQYGYQTGNLDRSLASNDVSTQDQIANLQRLATEGKLDLTRTAEGQVGTNTLASLGYQDLLGNQPGNTAIGGSIPRQQALDSFGFASNFVF